MRHCSLVCICITVFMRPCPRPGPSGSVLHTRLLPVQTDRGTQCWRAWQVSGGLYVMIGVPIDSRGIVLHQHGPQARLGACCGAWHTIQQLRQVLKLHVHCQCWCIAQPCHSRWQLSGGLYATFGVPIDSRGIGHHQHGPQARLGACCGPRHAIWPRRPSVQLSMQGPRWLRHHPS